MPTEVLNIDSSRIASRFLFSHRELAYKRPLILSGLDQASKLL